MTKSHVLPVVDGWPDRHTDVNMIMLLRRAGGFLFRNFAIDDLLRATGLLGTPVLHPDGDSEGWTAISPDLRTGENTEAFTFNGLGPHTDGTAVLNPPDILIMYCDQPATTGGVSVLADGADVIHKLSARWTVDQLTQDLYLETRSRDDRRPIVDIDERICRLRYRDDALAWPASDVPELVDDFRTQLSTVARLEALQPQSGVVLNNRRWLHGRSAFSGDRAMRRILLQAHVHIGFEGGFYLSSSSDAS